MTFDSFIYANRCKIIARKSAKYAIDLFKFINFEGQTIVDEESSSNVVLLVS